MIQAVQGGSLDHTQLAPGAFRGKLLHVADDAIALDFGSYNLPVLAEGPLPKEAITLGFVLHRSSVAVLNGIELAPSTMVTYTEGHDLVAALPENCAWVSMQLSRADLCALGWRVPAQGFAARGLDNKLRMAFNEVLLGELNLLQRSSSAWQNAAKLTANATAVPPAYATAHAIRQFEDFGIAALFATFDAPSRKTRKMDLETRAGSYRLARRVARYMSDQLSQPLRIIEICCANRCSYKELQSAFRRTYGVTPKHYLSVRRLRALRELLLHDQSITEITDASLQCGLTHFGRTSAAYRKMFGELPSETLLRK
ncbi:MAG TPA: AraC family transcriptional regulator [Woeseiaceae bacterium]|nr:AraC family transcriptional regulator [Woeseiaceae bacterium]